MIFGPCVVPVVYVLSNIIGRLINKGRGVGKNRGVYGQEIPLNIGPSNPNPVRGWQHGFDYNPPPPKPANTVIEDIITYKVIDGLWNGW